jgi:tetratricopeptide (TPR) repeat protein
MARTGLPINRRAGVVLIALCMGTLSATAGDDLNVRKANQLALQAALEEGLDHLQRGHYREAVVALEKQIALIDGNRRYLMALRDAYRGYVRELQQAGKHKEAKTYQDFLAILEPSAGRSPIGPEKEAAKEKVVQAPSTDKLAPAQVPVKGPAVVGRGKIDDPFDESNSAVAGKRGRSLLAQAESEFEARHYEKASQLYGEADRAEPGITAACQDRWTYCRMFCVMQKVEVKHTPRLGNGWAIAETTHFRIFHAQSREGAEKAARIAEATRVTMTRKWFDEAEEPWSPRCDVYLHPTVKGYTQTRGNPPATSPGHSTISLDSGRVVERRIDVRCDEPNMLSAVLPHETTHVVFAGRFGRHHVPRWADEGAAVLSEPRERINLHLDNLPKHRREGTLLGIGQLLRMEQYPEARLVGPFYAQSVSLVEFLCKKKGASTFTRFLRTGLDGGYEEALRRHYGYHSVDELEREWQQYAFGAGAVAATTEKRP